MTLLAQELAISPLHISGIGPYCDHSALGLAEIIQPPSISIGIFTLMPRICTSAIGQSLLVPYSETTSVQHWNPVALGPGGLNKTYHSLGGIYYCIRVIFYLDFLRVNRGYFHGMAVCSVHV